MDIVVTILLALVVPFCLFIIYVIAPFIRWLSLVFNVTKRENEFNSRYTWLQDNIPYNYRGEYNNIKLDLSCKNPARKRSTVDLISNLNEYEKINEGRLMSDVINNRLQKGQGMLEFGLLIILVAIVVIAVLVLFGPAIGNMFSNIVSNI